MQQITTSVPYKNIVKNSSLRLSQNEFLKISILLLIFIFAFYSPTLLEGKLPLSASYLNLIYPWATVTQHPRSAAVANNVLSDIYDGQIPSMQAYLTHLKTGEFPFWNPYTNTGAPDGLIFFGLRFSIYQPLVVFFGTMWGTFLYMVVKNYIVGIFFYFYMRYRGHSWQASVSGSLVLMFSAYMVVTASRSVADSIIYIPAILYFTERFVKEQARNRHFIGIVLSVALTIVSGFPAITLYSLILVSLYILFRVFFEIEVPRAAQAAHHLVWIYSGFIIAIFLVSVTLLPTYEYLKTVNVGYREGRGAARFTIISAARLLNPNICGNPIFASRWSCDSNYSESATYVGLLPLMIIPLSILNKKNWKTALFFLIAALLILLIIFGISDLYRLVARLPIFSMNPNTRMAALLPVCFAFMTTIGLDNLKLLGKKVAVFSHFFFLMLFFLVDYAFTNMPRKGIQTADNIFFFQKQEFYTLFILLAVWLVITVYFLLRDKQDLLQPALNLLVLAIFLGFFVFLKGYQGESFPDEFYPQTPAINYLQKELPDYERVLVIGRQFTPSMPLYYSINTIVGHAFANREFKGNMDLISTGLYATNTTQPIITTSSINLLSPIIDLYRIKYIVTPPFDQPLKNQIYAAQQDYNDQISLNKIESFGQEITPDRDGEILGIHVLMSLPNLDSIPAKLKITDSAKRTKIVEGLFKKEPDGNYFYFEFNSLTVQKGQQFTVEIFLDETALPKNSIASAVNINLYKGGALLVDGKPQATSDMVFFIAKTNPEIDQKYSLVHSGDLNIYKNTTSGGRNIPIVNKSVYSPLDQCSQVLGKIDPFSEVVVNEEGLVLSGTNTNSTARIIEMTGNTIKIDTDSAEKGSMVVLSDTFFPGWHATIDGKPTDIHRVNCSMRGVLVSSGKHTIEMVYLPLSFQIGFGISMVTLAGLLLFFFFGKIK
jgi:hypothetical protein